ncbi:1-phosphofructokinase family hexose kinase [Metabacillus sp. RGM 3146]|uniref:1-phosphofructokinase family hexose kinase n=1 Tax=Metabacillus sp. RGM 3146 TaxID=3401092 RepID=UPI003B9C59EA
MITAVTFNAAIDKTYVINCFRKNEVNRAGKVILEPGGKGNNVAKVLKVLGIPVTASGFAGGINGQWIEMLLEEKEIQHDFIRIAGESRMCISIIEDESTQEQTELLEKGPHVTEGDWLKWMGKLSGYAAKSRYVVFSGSLPEGLSSDAYKESIKIVNEAGSKAVLDSSGLALIKGIEGVPHFIKPNRHEFLALIQKEEFVMSDFISFADDLHTKGTEYVCVTLGKEGAVLSHFGKIFAAAPPSIKAINAVGSGDAFFAGMLAGLYRKKDPAEALNLAIASSAANALQLAAGSVSIKEITEQLKKIQET